MFPQFLHQFSIVSSYCPSDSSKIVEIWVHMSAMNAPVMTYRPGVAPSPAEEPQSIEKTLELLSASFGPSPLEDLAVLRTCLPALTDVSANSVQYQRLLELFFIRTQKLTADLKPRLRDASLPLAREIRHIARDLGDAFKAVAGGYRWVLANLGQRGAVPAQNDPARLMGRAMKCLAEQLEIAALISAPQPGGVWHAAFQLFLEVQRQEASSAPGPEAAQVFREMLALSACQPESLSAEEVVMVAEYLGLFAAAVTISENPPAAPEADQSLHWFEVEHDHAPYAYNRRTPTFGGDQVLYFSCAGLAEVADGHIRALENGFPPVDLRLPPAAAEPRFLALLQRLRQVWQEAPKRMQPRRKNNYRLQLCPGFDTFWRLMEQADQGIPVLDVGLVSDWMVINESPAGYALMHVSGDVSNLHNGSVVAVRTKAGQPWEVCVVRWMSSENPEHIELGLQIVAQGAQPIRVAFRGVKNPELQRALMLEPMAALRPHKAILTVAGTCRSRRFLIVAGTNKTYVAQGNMLSLDMQTGYVELFQFEHDPYPI